MVKVFVYGSLKRGGFLNAYMRTGTFLREAKLRGFSLWSVGPFPAMLWTEDKETDFVLGEVWEMPEYVIPTLDRVEWMYERVLVETEDGDEVSTYVWASPLEWLKHWHGSEWKVDA